MAGTLIKINGCGHRDLILTVATRKVNYIGQFKVTQIEYFGRHSLV